MIGSDNSGTLSTHGAQYTAWLIKRHTLWWRRFLDLQAPYRWNLNRLKPGLVLDIGCGIGRNLINLRGKGVGIDHNLQSVEFARRHRCIAFTPEEFQVSAFNTLGRFDSLLLSHVAEHMNKKEALELLKKYMYLLKREGRLIIITPQEAGYRSDRTHVEFMDFAKLRDIIKELKFMLLKEYSFPLPRIFGHWFIYNEFVSVSCRPSF